MCKILRLSLQIGQVSLSFRGVWLFIFFTEILVLDALFCYLDLAHVLYYWALLLNKNSHDIDFLTNHMQLGSIASFVFMAIS